MCLEEEVHLLPGLQGPDVAVLQRGLKNLAPGGSGVVLLVMVVVMVVMVVMVWW